MTSTPEGRDDAVDSPDLDAIGDDHMPADLRRAERETTAADVETDAETGESAVGPVPEADQPEG
ncbi:hypothetical protein BH18ACT9_BH18ACT9_11030 [soil metagenome]